MSQTVSSSPLGKNNCGLSVVGAAAAGHGANCSKSNAIERWEAPPMPSRLLRFVLASSLCMPSRCWVIILLLELIALIGCLTGACSSISGSRSEGATNSQYILSQDLDSCYNNTVRVTCLEKYFLYLLSEKNFFSLPEFSASAYWDHLVVCVLPTSRHCGHPICLLDKATQYLWFVNYLKERHFNLFPRDLGSL